MRPRRLLGAIVAFGSILVGVGPSTAGNAASTHMFAGPALVSDLLKNDPTAIAIVAGTLTRNINDLGLEAGVVQGDTRTFAYRVVSGYRQLGYSFPPGQAAFDRPQEIVQSRFQTREGLPVTPTIDAGLLIRLDLLVSQREAADGLLAVRFPLVQKMKDAPLNEPSKTHLAAIYTLTYEKLPSALVPWTSENFEYAFLLQGPPTIHYLGPTDFEVCDSFYHPTYGFDCAIPDPYVWVWNDDFSLANTLLHEYAHFLDGMVYSNVAGTASGTLQPLAFYGISFDTAHGIVDGWTFYPRRTSSVSDFVSSYAMGWAHNTVPGYYTAQEDFAESFAAYVLHGYVFRDLARSNAALAQKYEWLRQNVFAGREYDTGNRNYAAFHGAGFPPFNVIDYSRDDPGFVWDYTVNILANPPAPVGFFTVTPCRVIDTRLPAGPYGGPPVASGTTRTVTIAGQCEIPRTAKSVVFNITATNSAALGHLTLFPGKTPVPLASTISFRPGQTRGNNAIVSLGAAGDVAVSCVLGGPGATDVILDVTGYFE